MISRTVKSIIKRAVNQAKSTNRYDICFEVSNILMERYEETNLEYHCARMKLDTTKKILSAIDIFFYKSYDKEF